MAEESTMVSGLEYILDATKKFKVKHMLLHAGFKLKIWNKIV